MNKKLVQISFAQDEYTELLNSALESNMNISDFIKKYESIKIPKNILCYSSV